MISEPTEFARSTHVDQLLTEARTALEARRLGAALNAFRRAADAGRTSEGLRRRVFDGLVEGAHTVTGTDWRLAESMLRLAEGLDVRLRAPDQIWQPIQRELCEEYVQNVLGDISGMETADNLPRFRGRLLHALHRYPGEPRLAERLKSIDRALEAPAGAGPRPEPATSEKKRPPVPEPAESVSTEIGDVLPEVSAAGWSVGKGIGVAAAILLLCAAVYFGVRHTGAPAVSDAAAKAYAVATAPSRSVGTLIVGSDVANPQILVNGRRYTGPEGQGKLAIALPPDTYQIRATRDGYSDYGPVAVAVAKDSETVVHLHLESKPAALIRKPVVPAASPVAPANTTRTITAAELPLPTHPENRALLERLQEIERTRTVQNDWNSIDYENQDALMAFLGRHPDGALAGRAHELLAELERKRALVELARADDSAWGAIDMKSHAAIEGYLRQFPAARHRDQAEQALAGLHQQEQASHAVVAMLQRYATAWNAKDVESITTLHRSLDRKTVKAQLAPVTRIRMVITPASAAQIDGERATIVCRRQVSETFSDGTEKESPDLLVTFTLSKRDGAWSIDGTH